MTSSQELPFTCALITGGGGGIGRAIAEYFIKKGKKVIIAGRTESNLRTTTTEIGATAYYVLDTGDIAQIPGVLSRILSEHPEIDCLVNNAGVQRPLDVMKMTSEEFLSKADQEIAINVKGPMHLTLGLLEHFKGKKEAMVINVSSVLGFIPVSVINPVYNGTKAWLHMWSMNLRTQLKGTNIKVVEIAPPSVTTELHREREDPRDNTKEKNPAALSVEEFMDEIVPALEAGETTIGAGTSKGVVKKWFDAYGKQYEGRAEEWGK